MSEPGWLREAKTLYERGLLLGRALGITYRRENPSEAYVSVPPAHQITDRDGASWTFGHEYIQPNPWRYEFSVLRNDVPTGQFAERMEFRRGRVFLFGIDGNRVVARSRRHII